MCACASVRHRRCSHWAHNSWAYYHNYQKIVIQKTTGKIIFMMIFFCPLFIVSSFVVTLCFSLARSLVRSFFVAAIAKSRFLFSHFHILIDRKKEQYEIFWISAFVCARIRTIYQTVKSLPHRFCLWTEISLCKTEQKYQFLQISRCWFLVFAWFCVSKMINFLWLIFFCSIVAKIRETKLTAAKY